MSDLVLLCDITFGTYIKLALAEPGQRPDMVSTHNCDSRETFEAAVNTYLESCGRPALIGAAIASRGWELDGELQLPDQGMALSRDDLRDIFGVKRLNLVNNFVARALAIPQLKPDEQQKVCGEPTTEEHVIAVLGPHHGLGLAALTPDGLGNWHAIPCEGGHSDLPVTNDREAEVVKALRSKYGHVAREYAVSRQGLVELWQALGEIDGEDVRVLTPAEILRLARTGDTQALETVQLSMGWLAGMASDVALVMGARGGIYLTGDTMDMLGDLFDPIAFTTRYRDKGRLSEYVSEIPVYRTLAREMELIGLATLFD